jgi:uncharacterized sodium:solute symporter family permease YidK
MFHTVYSNPLSQQVAMVVRCIALTQGRIFLLIHPLSSLAIQAMVTEEPFTYTVANVFCMRYVVMIVVQHTQLRITSLRT